MLPGRLPAQDKRRRDHVEDEREKRRALDVCAHVKNRQDDSDDLVGDDDDERDEGVLLQFVGHGHD